MSYEDEDYEDEEDGNDKDLHVTVVVTGVSKVADPEAVMETTEAIVEAAETGLINVDASPTWEGEEESYESKLNSFEADLRHNGQFAQEVFDMSEGWINTKIPLSLAERVHGAVWSALRECDRELVNNRTDVPQAIDRYELYGDLVNSNKEEHAKAVRDNYTILFT